MDDDEIAEAKAEARAAAEIRRRAARDALGAAPQAAVAALVAALRERGAEVISGYMPIRSEIDPRPAMLALAERGARLCTPVIAARNEPLRFREWRPGAAMERGPFGAMVPAEGGWLTPQAVIAPLLAFNADLHRLGYGGGFYDRTLQRLRREGEVFAIGYAFAAQEGEIPVEPTDQPLDALATEEGLRLRGG